MQISSLMRDHVVFRSLPYIYDDNVRPVLSAEASTANFPLSTGALTGDHRGGHVFGVKRAARENMPLTNR